jgi:uncharacterized membrane protein
MTLYELFLFFHVAAAIVWLGSGTLLQVLAAMATRADDDEGFAKLIGWTSVLGNRLFIPASLVVLVMGFALIGEGPWSFDQLWIVLALAGFAGTFLTGAIVLGPSSERIAALVERDGRMGPEAVAVARRMLLLGRIDAVALWLVAFVMVVKPTGDDVAVLALMALVLAGTAAYVLTRARSEERIAAA